MSDIPDRFPRKRDWPDDLERVCTGSNICYSGAKFGPTHLNVHETPSEVNHMMKTSPSDAMLELHHHGDHQVCVYVRNEEIIAVDARWEKPEVSETP